MMGDKTVPLMRAYQVVPINSMNIPMRPIAPGNREGEVPANQKEPCHNGNHQGHTPGNELEVLIVRKNLNENPRNEDYEDPNEEDPRANKQKQNEYPSDPSEPSR